VTLLPALTERGVLDSTKRDDLLLDLVLRHYAFIVPTADILGAAIRRAPTIGRPGLLVAFGLLAGPVLSASDAARVAVETIKATAMKPVLTLAVSDVTELAVTSMAARWKVQLCARLVTEQARIELRLLPQHLDAVNQVCVRLARYGS
jgi:hypothetical protein